MRRSGGAGDGGEGVGEAALAEGRPEVLEARLAVLGRGFWGPSGEGFPEGEKAWVLEARGLFLGDVDEDLSLRAAWRLGRKWLHRNCRQLQGKRPFLFLQRLPQKPGPSSSGRPVEAGQAGKTRSGGRAVLPEVPFPR